MGAASPWGIDEEAWAQAGIIRGKLLFMGFSAG
jgi:hypothetical protein